MRAAITDVQLSGYERVTPLVLFLITSELAPVVVAKLRLRSQRPDARGVLENLFNPIKRGTAMIGAICLRSLARATLLVISISMAILINSSPARSASTVDYLIQMVCVNSSNQPIYGDPYTCTNKRKLAIGESLPYHKIDYQQLQISDSFPINDLNNRTKGVQTYFFISELNTDSLFPNQVHLNPMPNNGTSGGYNIIGASSNYTFFSGTSDYGGYWQPWWTANCQTGGWLMLPVATMPISYGGTNSPTINYPNCSGSTSTSSSTLEWNSETPYTYATGKSIPTAYGFHYGPGYDSLEVNYFTEIYGVTRWEAWASSSSASGPSPDAQAACPNSSYTAFLHNKTMYMIACRDWTTIIQPAAPWNPIGTSASDPLVQTWAVDPLYTSTNILKNTHIGGTSRNPADCALSPWQRLYTSPSVLNWAFVNAGQPFTGPTLFTCILAFSIPQSPNGEAVYQEQNISATSGIYSYGTTLWTAGGTGTVDVGVIQRDSAGNAVASNYFTANVTTLPHTFASTMQMNPSTRKVIFTMYPKSVNIDFRFTGAFVARKP